MWCDVNWWDHFIQIEGGLHFKFQHHGSVNCIVIGPMYVTKNYASSSVPKFGDRWIFKPKVTDLGVTRFSPHGQFLSVGRIKLRNLPISASSWQSLTSDLLLSNLRCVAGQIMREHNIYNFNSGFDLYEKNMGTCGKSLMNGHWEELIVKVEELLHATDDPDNYYVLIRLIIQYTSDGLQRLESFLKLHVGAAMV